MQTIYTLVGDAVQELLLPGADEHVLPGIRWGAFDDLLQPHTGAVKRFSTPNLVHMLISSWAEPWLKKLRRVCSAATRRSGSQRRPRETSRAFLLPVLP